MSTFIDFETVKQKVDIASAVQFLDLKMTERNGQLRGSCPRCKGDERQLVVTPEKSAFYCWGEKKGGDVIGLVAHVLDISMKDAANKLMEGKQSAPNAQSPPTVPPEKREPNTVLKPLDYLQGEHEKVQALGVTPDTAKHFGAGYASKGIMRGKVALPIHTIGGELIAYCGKDEKGLSFPSNFKPQHFIFNSHRVEKQDTLYVVRDPVLVLTAYQNGVTNVVSFLSDITSESLDALSVLMQAKDIPFIELM